MNKKYYLYDEIKAWKDEGEYKDLFEEYDNYSLEGYIEAFSQVYNDFPDGTNEQTDRKKFLKAHILAELELCDIDRFDYFLDGLNEELREIQNKLKTLEDKFTNHRHALDKTYGEKPVW